MRMTHRYLPGVCLITISGDVDITTADKYRMSQLPECQLAQYRVLQACEAQQAARVTRHDENPTRRSGPRLPGV